VDRARTVLRERGGLGVLVGRFVAILRALMPAAAGAAQVPYRTFVTYNLIGGVIWGVGYSLLGYLAGSAYTVIERRVGAGLAIAVAALVVAVLVAWVVRRHRRERSTPDAPGTEPPSTGEPGAS
jgi:membrane-associated protein